MVPPPNLDTQRSAMMKLGFLIGEWSGEARMLRGPGQMVDLIQTEVAQFKLGGLVLMIEGLGRAKSSGEPVLQALGLMSFDDAAGTYRMRAYNDGRWLETEVELIDGPGLKWGFTLGEISTKSVLRINQAGEWTEEAEVTIGQSGPHRLLELSVSRASDAT